MKKVKSWIILTLAFYLLFLFWTIPAKYVWSFLDRHQALPAGVYVSGIEGPWTAGRIMKVRTGLTELSDLSWCFQPIGLLGGRLQLAMSGEFAGGGVTGIMRIGVKTIEFKKIRGRIPAAQLGQIYLPGVELAGMVELEDLGLIGKKGRLLGGSGQLAWRNAEVLAPYRMDLGGVTGELATDNNVTVLKLNDLGGGLQVSGLGSLAAEGKYSFDATVGARQGSSPELATFLQILGRPGADGMVRINHKGQLPIFF